jgi:hypothetical protein
MTAVLSYPAPRLLDSYESRVENDAEWGLGIAALGVIASLFGISIVAVVSICNWCHTTSSFQVCLNGVRRWFTTGC